MLRENANLNQNKFLRIINLTTPTLITERSEQENEQINQIYAYNIDRIRLMPGAERNADICTRNGRLEKENSADAEFGSDSLSDGY